jgi:hypothetical protein
VVKGKVYARMRKGNEEVYLGPWIPEFDELLAQGTLKPEEKGKKERPKEIEKKAKLERGREEGLKPLFYVFWSGMGIGWLSLILLALPFLVIPIPPEPPLLPS